MTLIIRNLNKKDISEALKIVLETKASCNASEAKKVMEMSLTTGIKPLNPNYYVLVLNGEIIGVSGLYYDYEDPEDIFLDGLFCSKAGIAKARLWNKDVGKSGKYLQKKESKNVMCFY